MAEKNDEIINEIIDEIESALKDTKGVAFHQRRLAFSLSLGSSTLIENYLKKKGILKPGAKINHLWFKKKKENVKKLISNQTISSIDEISKLDRFIDIAFEIEKERNELAYGKSVSEKVLREKINLFFELKKKVENA